MTFKSIWIHKGPEITKLKIKLTDLKTGYIPTVNDNVGLM